MTRPILTLTAALLGVLALTQSASASYYATCELSIEVLEVHAAAEPSPKPLTTVKARFKVSKVHKGGGHNPAHCDEFPKREWFDAALTAPTAALIAGVEVGAKLRIEFLHSSGVTPSGEHLSKTWTITPPPPEPKPKKSAPTQK